MNPSTFRFLTSCASDLRRAALLLRQGSCVALPTETVYGLAADALNPAALADIFSIKNRPLIDPLIVHVLDEVGISEIAEPDPRLGRLMQFWPGPLTVVLRSKSIIPNLVTAGKHTVAVRIPAHPVFREVLRLSGCPLAAPSANPFGYISPTQAVHVHESLGSRCPWIVDGGPSEFGVESTILDLSDSRSVRLLRHGPITVEKLESLLGEIKIVTHSEDVDQAHDAPGMLARHYSPTTRVILFPYGTLPEVTTLRSAILFLGRSTVFIKGAEIFFLSEDRSIEEAARHLFAMLRQLDALCFDTIYAELAPSIGIGAAFNDRLTRAAAR